MWSVGNGAVGLRIVLHRFERDLRLQPVLLLVERAHAVERLPHAGLRHRLPGVDQPAAEFRGGQDARRVHLQVARQHRCGEAGTRSALDAEADVDLLVVGRGLPIEERLDAGAKQAVAFEQALLRGDSLLQLRVGVGFAQVEIGWRSRVCPGFGGLETSPETEIDPTNQLFFVTNVSATPSR